MNNLPLLLSPERLEQLIWEGWKYQEIGDECGVTREAVRRYANKVLLPHQRKQHRLVKDTLSREDLVQLICDGWTYRRIANHYRFAYSSLRKHIYKLFTRRERDQLKAEALYRKLMDICPRCGVSFSEYPKQEGGNCLLCWCEANGVHHRVEIVESGVAVELGLVALS